MRNRVLGVGVVESEGPVAMADGSVWVVEMASARACITRVGPDGNVEVKFSTGGRPNGMTVDGDGRLWIAEAREGVVICAEPSGAEVKRIRNKDGKRFLWPNDLRFGPDGHLWLTDSGILDTDFISGIRIVDDYLDLPYFGCVYEIDPISGQVMRQIDQGIRFTNGIAFGPDGALYANETIDGAIYRYDVFGSGGGQRELFGNVNKDDNQQGWRGPDGMSFGADGRLYCTVYNQSDVTVLDSSGNVVERLPTNGAKPTNIAFSEVANEAYVTEVANSCVEVLEVPCPGLALHRPRLLL